MRTAGAECFLHHNIREARFMWAVKERECLESGKIAISQYDLVLSCIKLSPNQSFVTCISLVLPLTCIHDLIFLQNKWTGQMWARQGGWGWAFIHSPFIGAGCSQSTWPHVAADGVLTYGTKTQLRLSWARVLSSKLYPVFSNSLLFCSLRDPADLLPRQVVHVSSWDTPAGRFLF